MLVLLFSYRYSFTFSNFIFHLFTDWFQIYFFGIFYWLFISTFFFNGVFLFSWLFFPITFIHFVKNNKLFFQFMFPAYFCDCILFMTFIRSFFFVFYSFIHILFKPSPSNTHISPFLVDFIINSLKLWNSKFDDIHNFCWMLSNSFAINFIFFRIFM